EGSGMYSSNGGGAPSPRVSQVPTLSVGTATDSGEMVGGTVIVRSGSSPGRATSPGSSPVGSFGSSGMPCLSNSFSVGIIALDAGNPVGDLFVSLLPVYGREQHHSGRAERMAPEQLENVLRHIRKLTHGQ